MSTWSFKFKVRDNGSNGIRQAYHQARLYGHTSSQLTQDIIQLTTERYPKAPRWITSYWNGVTDTYRNLMYQNDLEYGGFIDGVWVSTHSDSATYYEKLGFSAREYHERAINKGHYWKVAKKPFFIGD